MPWCGCSLRPWPCSARRRRSPQRSTSPTRRIRRRPRRSTTSRSCRTAGRTRRRPARTPQVRVVAPQEGQKGGRGAAPEEGGRGGTPQAHDLPARRRRAGGTAVAGSCRGKAGARIGAPGQDEGRDRARRFDRRSGGGEARRMGEGCAIPTARPASNATLAFIRANPDWPSMSLLHRCAETRLWQERRDGATMRRFVGKEPTSALGRLALARARGRG